MQMLLLLSSVQLYTWTKNNNEILHLIVLENFVFNFRRCFPVHNKNSLVLFLGQEFRTRRLSFKLFMLRVKQELFLTFLLFFV